MNKKLWMFVVLMVALSFPVFAESPSNDKAVSALQDKLEQQTSQQMMVLKQYIKFCGGNEKLGKILYDKRYGRLTADYDLSSKAERMLYQVVAGTEQIPAHAVPTEQDTIVDLVGMIQRYYPNGISIRQDDGEITSIPGPLLGVVTATHSDAKNSKNGYELKLAFYGEDGQEMYAVTKTNVRRINHLIPWRSVAKLYRGIHSQKE